MLCAHEERTRFSHVLSCARLRERCVCRRYVFASILCMCTALTNPSYSDTLRSHTCRHRNGRWLPQLPGACMQRRSPLPPVPLAFN